MNDPELNERLYRPEPVINGVQVRPFNTRVKMKISALIRLADAAAGDLDNESFFTALYLIAAPIERVAINTLNKQAFLVDREKFFADLPERDFQQLVGWLNEVSALERATEVETVPKPGAATTGETAPPN